MFFPAAVPSGTRGVLRGDWLTQPINRVDESLNFGSGFVLIVLVRPGSVTGARSPGPAAASSASITSLIERRDRLGGLINEYRAAA